MEFFSLRSFVGAAAALTSLCCLPHTTLAGGGSFTQEVAADESKATTELGTGKFESFPFKVSVTVRGGYDDNVNLESFDEDDSLFTNAALGVTYQFGNARTQMSLNAGAGATYYFDRDTDDGGEDYDDFDYNAYLGFNINHRATPRLTLAAAVFATYQSQPDFGTLNRQNFTISRNSRDFFFSSNRFSVAYMWAPRFSTATSYSLGIVNYEDDFVSFFEDRFEHTIGNEFRFLIMPTTTIVGEYRFGLVDYTDFDARSSTSHFLLAGFDHSFNPRFNMSARAGVEFRSFDGDDLIDDVEDDDNRTHPYGEATVNYALGQRTSVSWFNRYSLEQPDVADAFTRSTYRTSLFLRHNITPRIVAGLSGAFQHDDYEGNLLIDDFNEQAFDIALSVRYAINRNFALDLGYQHTQVISDESLFREFARNRFYGGVTFSF